MSNDVRIPTPNEERNTLLKRSLFPVGVMLVVGLLIAGAMVYPRVFRAEDELGDSLVSAQVYDREQEIGKGARTPDGARRLQIEALLDERNLEKYVDTEVVIDSAPVVRRTDDYVFSVGPAQEKEMFVVVEPPQQTSELEMLKKASQPGNKVSIVGVIRKRPEITKAAELFHLGSMLTEEDLPAHLYIEAKRVRLEDAALRWEEAG